MGTRGSAAVFVRRYTSEAFFQGFERFVAETGQAANLALWELKGAVTVQVEAEHFRIAAVALLPAAEQVRRCMMSVKDTVMTCASRWNEMSLT